MEIEYKGANCLVLKSGTVSVIIDPKLSLQGQKDQKVESSVELVTEPRFIVSGDEKLLIDGPGEYEVMGVSVSGVPVRRHADEVGFKATVYRVVIGGFRVAVIGHIKAALSEEQLEALGIVDILTIPVGGGEYTLDAHEAAKVVSHIDPKLVVPTHYHDGVLKYEVAQDSLETFLKELGATQHETVEKLKLKNGSLPEVLTVAEIKRS